MHFFITFFIIYLTTIPFSNGSDPYYNVCSSVYYSCGRVHNIGYPFWGRERPQFCGLPEFLLTCSNGSEYPSIEAVENSYDGQVKVLRIDTSSQKMTISKFSFPKPSCRHGNWSDTLNLSTTFKPIPSVQNITLFYGCPNSIQTDEPKSFSFMCSNYNHTNGSALYFPEPSEPNIRKNLKLCKTNYSIPVPKRGLDELKNGNATLLSLLQQGFEVEYVANFTSCMICKKSGGTCGSSVSNSTSSSFVCHCPDGTQSPMCHISENKKVGLIIGLGISGGIILLIAALVALWYRKKLKFGHLNFVSRSVSLERSQSELERGNIYFGVPLFSYSELEEATDRFAQSRELGDGGFGTVYYGKLKDGREVAVKRLFEKSYKRVEQFINEVQILTCLRHQNLVSLYGCTSHHCRELLLVYEYVPNGTVADHLYGDKMKPGGLPWDVRLRIAIETASALSYLHASDIIHRDVKTNNILLDSSFSVKVADFGLSRLFPTDVTHVSTAPQGTPGYLDPEYHQCYQLTDKSDVYSFGVVLIELISSLPAVDMERHRQEINLSNYAMSRIQRCAFDELVDLQLGFMSDFKVRKMTISVAELAFQCLQHDKEFRPSMDEVSEGLRRIESVDYEALKAEEAAKNDGNLVKNICRPPSSPSEDDDAKELLANNHHLPHPSSPNSVMDKWGSRSTTPSTSK